MSLCSWLLDMGRGTRMLKEVEKSYAWCEHLLAGYLHKASALPHARFF